MLPQDTLNYQSSGVDISAGNAFVDRLKKMNPDIGGFGGLFPFGDQYLVASTDGVGTKLKLAFEQQRHNTIGIDLVAMCVNDIITTGAAPLFFLDYYATSNLDLDQAEAVVKGIHEGCRQSGMALLGGETAEMPGFYKENEYDLSGFAVGAVAKSEVIDGNQIKQGDVIIGLPSSGLHSNGFSLVRKVLEKDGSPPSDLLEPTRIYVNSVAEIKEKCFPKGIAHITGGGLLENIPRILPNGLGATIQLDSWTPQSVFEWIQQTGSVPTEEMFRVFNMGIGMVVIVSQEEAALCPIGHPIGIINSENGVKLQ